ncbi:MAG: hypothetical protein QGH51_05675 [Planctomycetota bacterium]|nr:hypothetical protein [Planctomycetota bacterium]
MTPTLLFLGAMPWFAFVAQATEVSTPTSQLEVQVEPGQIWRQNVQFESLVNHSDGSLSRWVFDYKIRLRCMSVTDGAFDVEGRFVDWLLRLESDHCRYEWFQGKFHLTGEKAPELRSPEGQSCRELLYAWSSGLRGTKLRFTLHPDGRITNLSGIETLHEKVQLALSGLGEETPPALLQFFGAGGLSRADCALQFALSFPRPTGQVEQGKEWGHQCEVEGLTSEMCQVTRKFQFLHTGRDRSAEIATIAMKPDFRHRDSEGKWVPFETVKGPQLPNRLELLLDSGLIHRMELNLKHKLPNGGWAGFVLHSKNVQ